MPRHDLKIHPPYFDAVYMRLKTYEIRVNDRNFKVGDELLLREWDPTTQTYSGRQVLVDVSYMTQGNWGIPDNLCVMAICRKSR